MTHSQAPLVANRFEVVLLIILSFVVSTRLIWLQIDQPARELTAEYDSTALSFNRSLAKLCAVPVEQDFPYPLAVADAPLDPISSTSPGLAAVFLGICLLEQLNANSFTSLATQFVTLTALLVAITARVITSSWVGGLIASAVVLSRGSVLQAKTLAGAYSIMQPSVCLYFLLAAIYARSRLAGLLPPIFFVLGLATLITPAFALTASAISATLCWHWLRDNGTSKSSFKYRKSLSIVAVALVYPIIVFLLAWVAPSSIKNLMTLAFTIKTPFDAIILFKQTLAAAWNAFLSTDVHERISVLVLLLSAIWTQYLQTGVPFFMRILVMTFILACLTDGALSVAGVPAGPTRSTLSMSLEPINVGLSAAVVWTGIRLLLMTIYPNYSRSSAHRGTLTDLDQNRL